MGPAYVSCYCAFCRSPRKVYRKRHVGALEVIYGLALGLSLSLLIWQELDPRFIPISVTIMGFAEILTQIRWRLSLTCRKCGFDPLMYLRSPELAAKRVRLTIEDRLKNPNVLDQRLPILETRAVKRRALRSPAEILPDLPSKQGLPSKR